ncbi:hypothetical protein DL95DRAFT_458835 [Leptodontidium sp. 2 PMI_412]|nr:hypothetical protein DL95DRAFT_458835 [Leptodontidium sp. 2 PMI_412]
MTIAQKLAVLFIQNFSEVVRNVRLGVSYAVSAMGTLQKGLAWWQFLAAAVGGIVVGGIACGIASGLGASWEDSKKIGLGAGILAALEERPLEGF